MEYVEYDINDIPIQIDGINLPGVPGPSNVVENQSDFNSEEDSEETDQDEEESKEKSKNPSTRKLSKLSPHLKGLMGEANLRYARGELEIAKRMCYEVIRQVPEAYEPYMTLAQMYENSNSKKYKGFLMLASHLDPTNIGLLCRLAELFLQDGNENEALACYTRGIKYDSKNFKLHKKRIELLEKKDDLKTLLVAKKTMVKRISKRKSELILKYSMDVSKEYFKQKSYYRAIEVLKVPLRRIPKQITQDCINMILELLLLCERYSECLDIFNQFCGFSFDISLTENDTILVNTYFKPDNLQVDLKMKFITCLVKLRANHLIPDLINNIIMEDDVEVVGDLYLDVVEALMHCNYYEEAVKLLVPLVKSKNFSLAAVWLKYAECLAGCQMPDQAVEAYFTVMTLAPSHIEVLYPLAMLLLKQNKKKEALDVLSQDLSTNKLDVAVLLEKMKLLKQINDWGSYWKSVELLLSRHCIILKHAEELRHLLTNASRNEKIARVKKLRKFRNECDDDVETHFISIREPSIEEEYNIYKEILQLALDRKEYSLMQRFTFMGLCSKRFSKYSNEIYLFALYACMFNKDIFHGYIIVRDLIVKHPKHMLCWNWFGMVTSTPDDIRHTRFLERQSKYLSEERYLIIANYNLSVGNYVHCINSFMNDLKQTKSSYSALVLGIAMSQYYCHRQIERSRKKVLIETITYLFLHYSKLRTKYAEQEVCYNLGRMYQHLGIMYLAEYYYRKVFKVHNKYLEKYPQILCLKREAAFNLHLIYKNSGNFVAARNLLYEQIVI